VGPNQAENGLFVRNSPSGNWRPLTVLRPARRIGADGSPPRSRIAAALRLNDAFYRDFC
jgi:hypothetical protein